VVGPCGRSLSAVEVPCDHMLLAVEHAATPEPLHDRFGNPSDSCTAIFYGFRTTDSMLDMAMLDSIIALLDSMLDFIERRIAGPPAAQRIFVRR
jgi:hypothetical protein